MFVTRLITWIIKIFRLNFWSLECDSGDDEEYGTVVDICFDGSEFESDIDNLDEYDEDDFRYWTNKVWTKLKKIISDEE